ncbi:NAD-dependent epimerase/dehydratase family protein [Daejeonella rubra]|uniref:NAD-dependent epimerase/dehydratase family protein n=1 Tax=Daejeonella rubra TaxID=990371 RepID=UPI0015A05900|nr:NAD(P)-dependent oxidoreductase [Daejeonella rubra]
MITGASGYIGATLSIYLKSKGFKVYALCRTISDDLVEKFKDIEIIIGDIASDETISKLISLDVRCVIHTVSLDHKQSEISSVETVNNINVLPVWRLADQFLRKGIEKFLYLSTIQVLGSLTKGVLNEDAIKAPSNSYGLTHSIGEELISFYNEKSVAHFCSVRLSNGYGAPVFKDNNCWWLVINDLCRMAFREKKIVLQSDGTAVRDFIHINDIAKAIHCILENNSLTDTLYHVSSSRTVSLLEVAHQIKKVYFNKYNEILPIFISGTIISDSVSASKASYVIDNTRLLKTGYSAEIDLEQGIPDIFNYLEHEY